MATLTSSRAISLTLTSFATSTATTSPISTTGTSGLLVPTTSRNFTTVPSFSVQVPHPSTSDSNQDGGGGGSHNSIGTGMAVGIGISLGFASVLIAMLGWQLLGNRQRRKRQSRGSSPFNFSRDEPVKPGTGSTSQSASVDGDMAKKNGVVETSTRLEWPPGQVETPLSSPGLPTPLPSPLPASPGFREPLLPKEPVPRREEAMTEPPFRGRPRSREPPPPREAITERLFRDPLSPKEPASPQEDMVKRPLDA